MARLSIYSQLSVLKVHSLYRGRKCMSFSLIHRKHRVMSASHFSRMVRNIKLKLEDNNLNNRFMSWRGRLETHVNQYMI
jgi:hypothetical protein